MRDRQSAVVGVVSGKGGVGKTNIAANLAVACGSLGGKVLLVDGDLGLANLDVLLGVCATRSAADVLRGDCTFEEAVVEGPRGIHLLPAASARPDLTTLSPTELARMLVPLFRSSAQYDLALLDLAAGIAPSVISLASSCDRLILVVTPDPTALADAYATLKVLGRVAPAMPIDCLVNRVQNVGEARQTFDRLERLAQRFLRSAPRYLGHLRSDRLLEDAALRQRAVVEAYPNSLAARGLVRLAQGLLRIEPGGVPAESRLPQEPWGIR